ncbi:MAG: DNA polymerase III subunit delta' [Parcubacteria group bacterium]|nr:DNA polymerase III subunit delta' [Parcubacteria group bacterium]|tara:strand:+ start:4318 stop:5361 length:1044 start_codon:yes stop_codon:yes gene_type:complete
MSKDAEENSRFNWPIVGHLNIVNYLQRSLTNNSIAHAYLFVGTPHLGKATVAKSFTDSLICQNLAKDNEDNEKIPCGSCNGCKQIKNGIHPDVYWLSREVNDKTDKLKKNISIEQIRQIQSKLSLHSFLNSYKIAIIDEAETLSLEAANALLKLLEEPTAKTVLILLTANLAKIPKTVASRCQVLKFLPVKYEDIFDHLRSLKVDRKKATVLANLSFGQPGMAINYATDNELYLDFQDQAKQFVTLLGSKANTRLKMLGEVVDLKDINSIKDSLNIWSKVLRDLVLIKLNNENLISNHRFLTDLKELASKFSPKSLASTIINLNSSRRYLDANVNPKLVLENLVLNF